MTTIEELNKEIEVAKKHGLPDFLDLWLLPLWHEAHGMETVK